MCPSGFTEAQVLPEHDVAHAVRPRHAAHPFLLILPAIYSSWPPSSARPAPKRSDAGWPSPAGKAQESMPGGVSHILNGKKKKGHDPDTRRGLPSEQRNLRLCDLRYYTRKSPHSLRHPSSLPMHRRMCPAVACRIRSRMLGRGLGSRLLRGPVLGGFVVQMQPDAE